MSLIKGFDRIFLIISILSIIPVFLLLPDIIRETLKKEASEYKNYEINIKKQINNELDRLSDDDVLKWYNDYSLKSLKDQRFNRDISDYPHYTDKPREFYSRIKYKELISKAPTQFKYPTVIEVLGISFILAIVEAIFLFFILKGTTRLIKWVVDGFKDK